MAGLQGGLFSEAVASRQDGYFYAARNKEEW